MAYSGISAVTLAWKRIIKSEAMSARAMMPREKTSRLPLYINCLGRKPSPACSAPRRGKSAKDVLAAMIRISVVATIVAR